MFWYENHCIDVEQETGHNLNHFTGAYMRHSDSGIYYVIRGLNLKLLRIIAIWILVVILEIFRGFGILDQKKWSR